MKRLFKKSILWLLLAAMLTMSLAGCQDGDGTEPPTTEAPKGGEETTDGTEAGNPTPEPAPEPEPPAEEDSRVTLATKTDGKAKSGYALVRSFQGTYSQAASQILSVMEGVTGDSGILLTDDIEDRPTGVNLILVGNDLDTEKYPELAEIAAEWEILDYGIAKVGETLLVYADNMKGMDMAAELAIAQIRAAKWEDNQLRMTLPEELKRSDGSLLSDFPHFSEAKLASYYYNHDDEIVYEYKKVTREEFDAYVAELAAAGFVDERGGHTIGNNLFATCLHPEKGQVHVGFFPSGNTAKGDMTVFASKLEATVAAPRDTYNEETDKVTDAVFHVMSQDYTNRGENISDGNGMCYIMTLKDGRFVIFDGGYDYNDAPNIYNYMKANNKRADGRIVIAAWFMSHSHGDHYHAFRKFMSTPALYENVTIEHFVANAPSEEKSDEKWMHNSLPALLKRGDIPLIKPHVGQVLSFAGTEFEIILSHEMVMSSDVNNMSTVVRIRENGHTILLTADSMGGGCAKMVSLYGDALKSDVLQINHHGHSGGTVSFFEKVDPTYALWTTSQNGFEERIDTVSNGNAWIRDNVLAENCFVADDEIEQIFLPKDGALYVVTDTGFRVTNNFPKAEGDGILQIPKTSEV